MLLVLMVHINWITVSVPGESLTLCLSSPLMIESIIYLFKACVKNQLCKVEQNTPLNLAKVHPQRGDLTVML
jgi:hypothetical protein